MKRLFLKDRQTRVYFFLAVLISLAVTFLGMSVDRYGVALFVQSAGVFAPLVYMLALNVTHLIAPLSGTPIFLTGFFLFGVNVIVLLYIAMVLSSVINFWIARIWGRALITRFIGEKNSNKVDHFSKDYGVKSLIILRIFFGSFHDFISYAYGLTNMSFRKYFVISATATLPWLFFWKFFLFDRVDSFVEFVAWNVVIIGVFLTIAAFVFRKHRPTK